MTAPHLEPGPETRRVQLALLAAGHDLKLDGKPGPRTRQALARWAAEHSVGLHQAAVEVVLAHQRMADGKRKAQFAACWYSESMLIVGGLFMRGPDGIPVRNWYSPGVQPLRDVGPRKSTRHVVLHESVTAPWYQRVVDVLARRHLGVHLIVSADGSVTQHVDLDHRTVHAGGLNARSIAIEVANPYYPPKLDPGEPGKDWIPAVWAHKGRYLLPTPAQCETTWQLVWWLCYDGGRPLLRGDPHWPPLAFPGVLGNVYLWGRVKGAAKAPGVQAHSRSSNHSDGAFPELFCVLRLRGADVTEAYERAVAMAGSGQRTSPLPPVAEV